MWQWHCTRARTKSDWNRLEQWSWYKLIWADIVSWTSWRCSNSEESIRVETYRKPPCTSTLHFQGKQFRSKPGVSGQLDIRQVFGNPRNQLIQGPSGSVRVRQGPSHSQILPKWGTLGPHLHGPPVVIARLKIGNIASARWTHGHDGRWITMGMGEWCSGERGEHHSASFNIIQLYSADGCSWCSLMFIQLTHRLSPNHALSGTWELFWLIDFNSHPGFLGPQVTRRPLRREHLSLAHGANMSKSAFCWQFECQKKQIRIDQVYICILYYMYICIYYMPVIGNLDNHQISCFTMNQWNQWTIADGQVHRSLPPSPRRFIRATSPRPAIDDGLTMDWRVACV